MFFPLLTLISFSLVLGKNGLIYGIRRGSKVELGCYLICYGVFLMDTSLQNGAILQVN